MNKVFLDESSKCLIDQLRHHLKELLLNYLKSDNSEQGKKYSQSFVKCIEKLKEHLDIFFHHNDLIMSNARKYDIDENHQYNGYRSLELMFIKCCNLSIKSIIYMERSGNKHKKSSLYKMHGLLKLVKKLVEIYKFANHMQQFTNNTNTLFFHNYEFDESVEFNLMKLSIENPEATFGDTCAFQFEDSLQFPLNSIATSLASFNDGYKKYENMIGQMTKSLFSGSYYEISKKRRRARKIGAILKDEGIEFCKFYWNSLEHPLINSSIHLKTPNLKVNIVRTLEPNILKIQKTDSNETIDITPPFGKSEDDKLNIRILSAEIREGMHRLDQLIRIQAYLSKPKEQSPHLVLHAHGGGFIAQTSKSHQMYLRPWCKYLHVPIVSIDYSLAPEHPFPKASEECFYAYVWCLLNKDLLGWTGEKIVCVGDSAGGVLVTNIVQRAIAYGIRIPDALVPIYTPFLLSYSLSPSRLMSIMDPLLNLGFLWRYLAAYFGIKINKPLSDSYVNTTTDESTFNNENLESVISANSIEKHQKLFGNSVSYILALRKHELAKNPYVSPLLADDEILKKLPKTILVTSNVDPLLDDSIEFKKKLDKLNVHCKLHVLSGLTHGFLNFSQISPECSNARFFVAQLLKIALNN